MSATKSLSIGNLLGLALVLTLNTLANALPINGMTTGQISDLYPSLFTPIGFTFSIWGIIYLLLIVFGLAQFFIKDQSYFKELSLWFMLSCIANASWILVWHYLFTTASVVVMLVLLYSLVQIFVILQKNAVTKTQWFTIKLPFVFYFSWICVATIANISALLVSMGWDGGFLSAEYWTVTMVIIAALLGLYISIQFKEPAFLLVLLWAFFGIYSKWIETEHEIIANTARIAAIVLAITLGKLVVDKRKSY